MTLSSRWPLLPLPAARLLALVMALVLASLPLGAPSTPAAAQQAAEREVQVQVVDFAFEPATLTVPVGTVVTWTNAGDASHTVTAADGAFDSGRLDPGESFSFRFETPGTVTYRCDFHPEMQATVVVTEERAEPAEAADPNATTPADEPAAAAAATPDAAAAASGDPAPNLTPVAEPRLAHVHAGTCEELGIVVYSLAGLRGYRSEPAAGSGGAVGELVVGTAGVPLPDLFGEPFSIHVHQSAAEKQVYVACADVGGRPAAPWSEAEGLVLAMDEQNDSGFAGFATLHPSATGGTDLVISLAGTEETVEAARAQPTPPPGATYASPTFGYTITYGPTWDVSEEVSGGGRDRFVLFNGTSYVTFTGAAGFGGNPRRCVDGFVETLTADPNVRNLGLAVDERGEPLQGGTAATGAFAVFNHDYVFPDRVEAYTLFVGCSPLVANESVLAIVQNVPTEEYASQVEPREALLRGLALDQ